MMVVEWVVPRVGCKGEYLEVSGHHVIGSLLVGSGCSFLVFGPGSSIPKKLV